MAGVSQGIHAVWCDVVFQCVNNFSIDGMDLVGSGLVFDIRTRRLLAMCC